MLRKQQSREPRNLATPSQLTVANGFFEDFRIAGSQQTPSQLTVANGFFEDFRIAGSQQTPSQVVRATGLSLALGPPSESSRGGKRTRECSIGVICVTAVLGTS
jgi:hypothetical protein